MAEEVNVSESSIKKLANSIREANETSASDKAIQIEAANEEKIRAKEQLSIFEAIQKSLDNLSKMDKGVGKNKTAWGMGVGGLFGGIGIGEMVDGYATGVSLKLGEAWTTLSTTTGGQIIKQFASKIPIIALASGLAIAVKDGIDGWMMSEEWGTDKLAGFLGGFFGGTGAGIDNAFKNAGKWALIGSGVGGLLFSVPGAIAGGLLGAAIGGILGYIGGETIAKSFDGIGSWFAEKFNSLIVAPIKSVWNVIAPEWVKSIDFTWDDLFPPALTKLFSGQYFTVDFPEFSWTDLFPKFLVDLFNNVAVAGKDVTFEWTDLLPEFFGKFFRGEYSTEGSFQWSDLLPPFINKIIGVAKTAWADTEFTYKSLLPNFIVKLIEGTEVTPTGTFSWTDLVPEFIWKLADGTVKAASTPEGFKWQNLLPDWMNGAWDSTVGLTKQAYFGWKNLLPEWMQSYLTSAEDKVPGVLKDVGKFYWTNMIPQFIQDFITDPTQLSKENYSFEWTDLFPPFMRDFLLGGKSIVDKGLETASETLPTADEFKEKIFKPLLDIFPESVLGIDFRRRIGEFMGIQAMAGGGIVGSQPKLESGGLFTLTKGEMVLDNQAAAVFMKAAELLTGSQNMAMSQSTQPVVINNIDNSQRNPIVSSQATQIKVPDSPRQGESTMAMMNMAYAMG